MALRDDYRRTPHSNRLERSVARVDFEVDETRAPHLDALFHPPARGAVFKSFSLGEITRERAGRGARGRVFLDANEMGKGAGVNRGTRRFDVVREGVNLRRP